MGKHWKLYVMGCRGSFPVCGEQYQEFGGATSCYILKRGDRAIVLDCGTGLYASGGLLRDCGRVDVLLTHVHYDHLLGLLNWGVFPKAARVRFYGQFDAWYGEATLKRFMSPPFWPYTPEMGEMIPVASPGTAELGEGVTARFYPSNHPDGASIVRVDTEDGAVCAAFDYEHSASFPEHMAEGCAVLLYDAMYDASEYEAHRGWGHSCWQEGCALAAGLDVRELALTHHAPDRTDADLRSLEQAARQVFPHARFARAGDVFELSNEGGWKQ